jgi:hypothetical protein
MVPKTELNTQDKDLQAMMYMSNAANDKTKQPASEKETNDMAMKALMHLLKSKKQTQEGNETQNQTETETQTQTIDTRSGDNGREKIVDIRAEEIAERKYDLKKLAMEGWSSSTSSEIEDAEEKTTTQAPRLPLIQETERDHLGIPNPAAEHKSIWEALGLKPGASDDEVLTGVVFSILCVVLPCFNTHAHIHVYIYIYTHRHKHTHTHTYACIGINHGRR